MRTATSFIAWRTGLVTLSCTFLLCACDDGPTAPAPVRIVMLSGDLQVARVGSTLPMSLGVRVVDRDGSPVADVPIEWVVGQHSGSISEADVPSLTSRYGMASARHTLGPDDGPQTVTATATSIPDVPAVTFTAHAVTALVSVAPGDYWECWYYNICSGEFSPSSVVVGAGQSVGWQWDGTCDLIFEDDPTEPVSSASRDEGTHFRTFPEPGTYRYRCTHYSTDFSVGMVGTVTVE